MSDYQQIELTESDDVAIVRFKTYKITNELHVKLFGEELLSLVEAGRKKVVLDFENVEFLSSAALGHLIKLRKRAKAAESKVVLTNIRDTIFEVFSITGLDQEFTITKSLDEAVKGLA
jgi:anti-sigma B factor antagonist